MAKTIENSWIPTRNGLTLRVETTISYSNGRLPESRAIWIEWRNNRREIVTLTDGAEYLEIPAASLFAWVDRVRENGETDL